MDSYKLSQSSISFEYVAKLLFNNIDYTIII